MCKPTKSDAGCRGDSDQGLKHKFVSTDVKVSFAFPAGHPICAGMNKIMLPRLALVFAGLLASTAPAWAQDEADPAVVEEIMEEVEVLSVLEQWQANPSTIFESIDINIEDLLFVARPLVVFADSPADPLFVEQMELLADQFAALEVRDVILIVDTDPAARSAVRQELRPRGFALVLISKEGRVSQRKPSPWSVRELSRAIDKMPVRQQEIRDANG